MIARVLTGKELNLVLRLLLGGMFLFAAWDKVANPSAFAIAVRGYQIIPPSLSGLFALCLAWSEAIAGVLLLIGLMTRPAAGAVFLMLLMFVAALSTVLVKGMVVDCGCFGPDGGSAVSPLLIIRNVLLMVAAFLVIRYNHGFLGIDGVIRNRK